MEARVRLGAPARGTRRPARPRDHRAVGGGLGPRPRRGEVGRRPHRVELPLLHNPQLVILRGGHP